MSYQLLGFNNPKTKKGEEVSNYLTAIMNLLPDDLADEQTNRDTLRTVCAYAKIAGCREACLNTAGRGGIIKKGETTNVIQEARKRKTKLFLDARDIFMEYLIADITKFVKYCEKKSKLPCVRLNGTSDIQWETIQVNGQNIFEMFPDVQFYDYTKIPTRKVEHISNYHLTWSYSEANIKYANWFDKIAYNIAVVFNGDMPIHFKGREVVNGDETDLRFLDKQNVIVGLKAKGKARHDMSGFVIHTV